MAVPVEAVAVAPVEAVAVPVEAEGDEAGRERDNAAHLTAPEGAIFLTTGAWMPLPA